jgi:hypothetical protein
MRSYCGDYPPDGTLMDLATFLELPHKQEGLDTGDYIDPVEGPARLILKPDILSPAESIYGWVAWRQDDNADKSNLCGLSFTGRVVRPMC